MKDFYNKYVNLCISANKSPSKAAEEMGFSRTSPNGWKKGKIPSDANLIRIANYFGVTTDYFSEDEQKNKPTENDLSRFGLFNIPQMINIPLVGSIACGEPILAEENLEGYVKAPAFCEADFALRCKGDSMSGARILDGDIVMIRQQPDVDDGDIAAVLIDDEATLKRVYKMPGRLVLRPENPSYLPIDITGEDLNGIRILGKAVYFVSAIK